MQNQKPLPNRCLSNIARCVALLFVVSFVPLRAEVPISKNSTALKPILSYISAGWDTLTRSMDSCRSVADPKISSAAVLYIPQDLLEPESLRKLKAQCKVEVKVLPFRVSPGNEQSRHLDIPGLLFLPNKYVVPGGRFNEMYGWDSYFIILGLLRDGRLDLARGMVENFLFEIEHYGSVLNANRTYFLTRSQPPFLTSMILAVYKAEKAAGHEDSSWLKNAYTYASRDYQMWVREPHLAGNTGLSRYFDFGEGPVAEGLQDETGYYRNVAAYFLAHPEQAGHDLIESRPGQIPAEATGIPFSLNLCEGTASGQQCDDLKTVYLSHDYYKGDRSMRESGFDVSFRFGPFGAHTQDYAPVCLNSLLYKTETDLAEMATTLGEQHDADQWRKRAERRKQLIEKYLWDAQKGLFFDYDFETAHRSKYQYITTFYPLWVGLATAEQAAAVEKNLPIFEQSGGLVMSRTDSGAQWDYPYGWAPTQLLGIEGLRRYGFDEDANRLSYKFLSMVNENFHRDGTIREKYNVVTRSSGTHVTAGYAMNVVGFGWTNGVFLQLLHALPEKWAERLSRSPTTQQGTAQEIELHPTLKERGRDRPRAQNGP